MCYMCLVGTLIILSGDTFLCHHKQNVPDVEDGLLLLFFNFLNLYYGKFKPIQSKQKVLFIFASPLGPITVFCM